MKITYAPNPLRTTIELDDHEKKKFWYELKIEDMTWKLHGAHFYLSKEYFDVDRARQEIGLDTLYGENGEKSKLDKRTDEMHEYYLQALVDIHGGDCTCVPCSCDKCHAESVLGIDTIKGLRKHEASKVGSAFWQGKDLPERTLGEALAILENYEPKADWEGWEAHIPRWTEEGKRAYEWLKNYRDQHFTATRNS